MKLSLMLPPPATVAPFDLLGVVDLDPAYHHVDMHTSTWDYLGFEWQGQYYKFCVLPFGLNIACWVFTKLTRELVHRWRSSGIRLLHYLHDFFSACASITTFTLMQAKVLRDLSKAGFTVAAKKVDFTVSHIKKFLGFMVDTKDGKLRVSSKRRDELFTQLHTLINATGPVPVKLLAKVAGMINSMKPALGCSTRIFTRAMYRLMLKQLPTQKGKCNGRNQLSSLTKFCMKCNSG